MLCVQHLTTVFNSVMLFRFLYIHLFMHICMYVHICLHVDMYATIYGCTLTVELVLISCWN